LFETASKTWRKKGGELTVNAFPREPSVIIVISDIGAGISDEAKLRIFKPLFTTKSKGQSFGLTGVKKLVEALGGNVSFETKVRMIDSRSVSWMVAVDR